MTRTRFEVFFFFLNPYPTLFLIGSGKIRPIRVGPGRVPSGQAKIAIHDSWAELDLQAKHDAHTVYVVWVGMALGWGWRTESSFPPRMVLSCPILAPPHMMGKIFSLRPHLLGPYEALLHLIKLYFLLICPIISIIFLMKTISLIKIYLKLQLNLSYQIKSIFRKILNNISKCLTRKSPKEKKKKLIV